MSASKFFTGILTKNPDKGSDILPEQIEISVQVECYADDDSAIPAGAIIRFPYIKTPTADYFAGTAYLASDNTVIISFSEVND